jgi:hypothetical protein
MWYYNRVLKYEGRDVAHNIPNALGPVHKIYLTVYNVHEKCHLWF